MAEYGRRAMAICLRWTTPALPIKGQVWYVHATVMFGRRWGWSQSQLDLLQRDVDRWAKNRGLVMGPNGRYIIHFWLN